MSGGQRLGVFVVGGPEGESETLERAAASLLRARL
jgi:hypothetical protein